VRAGGEYSYGNARFHVFADAVASLGSEMIISTEPFSLVPSPTQARFAHYWRTGNDIGANWNTILNRIDINDKWASFAGPGHFNDPDMLQVGNGGLSIEEDRAHFGLWAITKATLILGSKVSALSKEQLAIVGNKDVIAINQVRNAAPLPPLICRPSSFSSDGLLRQALDKRKGTRTHSLTQSMAFRCTQDPLGVQAKKVAINGTLAPQFVGIAPCAMYEADAS
jgi:hypothetical protein